MMKKTKSRSVIIALIVVLLALAIGYAAFSSNLTINGTVTANGDWDVKFQSTALKTTGGVTADTKYGSATVGGTNSETITANVTLAYPGDGVILEAVVVNEGNVPAKLTNIQVSDPTDADIVITEAAPAKNEVLEPGNTCTAQFFIQWDPDSTKTQIDEQTFTVTYEYTQDTTTVNLTPEHTDNTTGA